LYLLGDGLGLFSGGLEGEGLLDIALCASDVIVMEIGTGEDEVGFGAGLESERCIGGVASFGKLVLEQQDAGESGESVGIGWLVGESLAELALGFYDGTAGEELAGTLDEKGSAIGGLGLVNGRFDGILQFDGKLAVGAFIVIALDAGERDGDDGGARRRGTPGTGGPRCHWDDG